MNRKQSEFPKLYDWYHKLEKSDRNADLSALLLGKLENAKNARERLALMSILEGEYNNQGRYDDAISIIRQQILLEPENPIHLIHLSENFLYYGNKLDDALASIEAAIILADTARNFRRHARATKARIAIASRNNAMLENCLNEIVDVQLHDGQLDVGRERDILDRAPKEALSEKVIKRYESYLND